MKIMLPPCSGKGYYSNHNDRSLAIHAEPRARATALERQTMPEQQPSLLTTQGRKILRLEQHEQGIVALLWALSFCVGYTLITLYSASRAIFLTRFTAADLPYMFIGMAVVLAPLRFAVVKLDKKLPKKQLFPMTFAFMGVSLALLYAWLSVLPNKSGALLLAVWLYVGFFLCNVGFWGLCGRLLDLRQAKRLFGLIASGEYVAAIAAGLLTQVLAPRLGALNLLLLCVAGMAASAILCRYILQKYDKAAAPHVADNGKENAHTEKTSSRKRYVHSLQMLWGLSTAGLFLADLAFNTEAREHAPTPERLAQFFSIFFAAGSAMVLLFRSLLTSRIISRLGPVKALFFLPAALGLCSLTLVAMHMLYPDFHMYMLWLALCLKFFDYTLRYGLFKPSFMVLYQPLPSKYRLSAQAAVEGFADPIATLAIGVFLLTTRIYTPLDAPTTCMVLLAVLLLWVGMTFILRQGYPKILMDAVKRKVFTEGADIILDDAQSIALVARRLESERPGEVIFSTEILEKNAPETIDSVLMTNLFHESEMVRLDALERIERLGLSYPASLVQELVDTDLSVEVRAEALRAFAASAQGDALDILLLHVDTPVDILRVSAMTGLIRYAGIEGVMAAGERLLLMSGAEDPKERVLSAKVLHKVGIQSFYRPIIPLLGDKDMQVRKAALIAAQKIQNPRLAPAILPNLGHSALAQDAIRALSVMGDAVLDPCVELIDIGMDLRARRNAVKVLALLPGERATQLLTERIIMPDFTMRLAILNALMHRGHHAAVEERGLTELLLDEELRFAAWHLKAAKLARSLKNGELLQNALQDEVRWSMKRVLVFLSFLLPSGQVREAIRSLEHHDPKRRAMALELIDTHLPPERKDRIMILLEDIPEAEKIPQMDKILPSPVEDVTLVMQNILERDSGAVNPWTRTAAAWVAGRNRITQLLPALENAVSQLDEFEEFEDWASMDHEDEIFLQTAHWAIERMQTSPSP